MNLTSLRRFTASSILFAWSGVRLTVISVIVIIAASTVQAQTYTILHNFTGGLDGGIPYAGLVMDHAGNLYGTASAGGSMSCSGGCGTVFKLSQHGSSWVFSTLYAFQGGADGAAPLAALFIAPDGSLYGTTIAGGGGSCFSDFGHGCGTVFRLKPAPSSCKAVVCPWIETVLYRFSGGADGASPDMGALVMDAAGNLYGTTGMGGSSGEGTVFELTPIGGGWTETVLHSFAGADGIDPLSGVIFDAAGNLYGTAESYNGTGDGGTVYQLSPSAQGWKLTVLHTFDGSVGDPVGGLLIDGSGNLYGTTFDFSGSYGWLYELSPSGRGWQFSQLVSLSFSGSLTGLAIDAAGSLYGVQPLSLNAGDVFKVTYSEGSWTFNQLHDFDYRDGSAPQGVPLVDAQNNVYGTTVSGGAGDQGVVFKISQP
jgi:uncharacterized repeat protein (TIGR03803 family)